MKSAILIRSASFRAPSNLPIGSDNSGSGAFNLRRSRSMISMSPKSAFNVEVTVRKESTIRRARSDTDLIVTDRPSRIWPPPARVPEEEEDEDLDREILIGLAAAAAAAAVVVDEEVEFAGGGRGRGRKLGGGGDRGGEGGDRNENRRIEKYYLEMLRSDPSNPLILRNYGKFLHEVEGDAKRAEECYSRAILASPNDGDVLSLYGKLVWETHRDEERADAYLQRAVEASPDDCYVLGSYASFLWDAEEDDDEEEATSAARPLVEAF